MTTRQNAVAQEAMYAEMAAMDNQDEPLENYSDRLVGALYRAGFVITPVVLPTDALGEAAVSGVADTGNPKHVWDFLIPRVMAKPLPSDAVICKNEKTESDDALRVAREEIKRQAAEIERLKTRLEVSPDHDYDGIYCRDATIKLQDEHIAKLREQKPVNARLLAIVHQTVGMIENTSIETGYCCCGDGMDGHASPMICGHSATDQGAYLAGLLYEDAKSAIAAAEAQQAEPSCCPRQDRIRTRGRRRPLRENGSRTSSRTHERGNHHHNSDDCRDIARAAGTGLARLKGFIVADTRHKPGIDQALVVPAAVVVACPVNDAPRNDASASMERPF